MYDVIHHVCGRRQTGADGRAHVIKVGIQGYPCRYVFT